MAKYGTTFAETPVVGYPLDTPEEVYTVLQNTIGLSEAQARLQRYRDNVYNPYLEPMLFHSPYKMNLGGENEKQRIITTERSSGIFDFSLASKTLQRDIEYYSERLANEYPDRFADKGLLSGIVPDDYVINFPVQGKPNFIFQDKVLNQDFSCEQRQKGETALEDGVQGARLGFKSSTRKTYKTYKRQKGKVRYVEIYSLFYYTSLSGDIEYAIRHFPAVLAAQYFESIGIKTRVYVTRFVKLPTNYQLYKKDQISGLELPQYDMVVNNKDTYANTNPQRQNSALFIQPFCVKDFGGENDPLLGFAVSQRTGDYFYDPLAYHCIGRETSISAIYGNPDWTEFAYFEGIERFRNKYRLYTDLGIYKSKEVLPEAMIFFHDYSIKTLLSDFASKFTNYFINNRGQRNFDKKTLFLTPEVNVIFSWWMRILGTKIKHKIDLLNTSSLSNEIRTIDNDLQNFKLESKIFIDSASNSTLQGLYVEWARKLIKETNTSTLYEYIIALNNEITTYAQDNYFATDEESIEKRDDYSLSITEALNSYL